MTTSGTDWRVRLTELKQELESLEASAQASGVTVELDQSRVGRLSRMDALQGQAMSNAVALRRRQTLQKIEAALERLDEGEFGFCLECGEEIAVKRLAIDPVTTYCTECQSRLG